AVLAGQLFGLRQPGRARRLHREERARVDVVLDARQGGDELRAPRRPTEPPPRHTERLRERVKLDRAVPCPGDLEDAGRDVTVVRDLAVRVVVRDHDAVPPTESDRALEIL